MEQKLPEVGSMWVAKVSGPQSADIGKGEIAVVFGYHAGGDVVYTCPEGYTWYARPDQWHTNFKPYEEPKDQEFKVGDKVKDNGEGFPLNNGGKVGTILGSDGDFYKVKFPDDKHEWSYLGLEMDLVEPTNEKTEVPEVECNEKTPTDESAGATKGKLSSDGGPSEYYDFPEGCATLNDLIEYKGMSFAQGNIFKAAYRLGNKEGISLEYDLKKIKYYADRMLAQIEGDK